MTNTLYSAIRNRHVVRNQEIGFTTNCTKGFWWGRIILRWIAIVHPSHPSQCSTKPEIRVEPPLFGRVLFPLFQTEGRQSSVVRTTYETCNIGSLMNNHTIASFPGAEFGLQCASSRIGIKSPIQKERYSPTCWSQPREGCWSKRRKQYNFDG